MRILKANIWKFYKKGYIIIPTNGCVKKNGENVMGKGLALQVKREYPSFPKIFGERLKQEGNIPMIFVGYGFITFPVKHNWWEKADLELIEESAKKLSQWIEMSVKKYMPKVGCGNGQRNWELEVKPIIEKYLPNITIIDWS